MQCYENKRKIIKCPKRKTKIKKNEWIKEKTKGIVESFALSGHEEFGLMRDDGCSLPWMTTGVKYVCVCVWLCEGTVGAINCFAVWFCCSQNNFDR